MILKSFRMCIIHLRTWFILCRKHNMVLDDVNNMEDLLTTIMVMGLNSMSILVIQSKPSSLTCSILDSLRILTNKHSNLMFFNLSQ
jgi:hypothetical protein